MTDRELLEAAAKAAGVPPDRLVYGYGKPLHEWNPLASDAEAFRLAVKLDVEVYQGDDDGPAVYAGYWGKPERRDVTRIFAIEPLGSDPYAATRRAIVRAAAALAKG